mmetsp:Transcript_13341/g.33845  ORF Transcript_13341/g.33845 Transcript_13341/m.33845 type:complete len:256 (-) Transcript_13341:375-1142(-)
MQVPRQVVHAGQRLRGESIRRQHRFLLFRILNLRIHKLIEPHQLLVEMSLGKSPIKSGDGVCPLFFVRVGSSHEVDQLLKVRSGNYCLHLPLRSLCGNLVHPLQVILRVLHINNRLLCNNGVFKPEKLALEFFEGVRANPRMTKIQNSVPPRGDKVEVHAGVNCNRHAKFLPQNVLDIVAIRSEIKVMCISQTRCAGPSIMTKSQFARASFRRRAHKNAFVPARYIQQVVGFREAEIAIQRILKVDIVVAHILNA